MAGYLFADISNKSEADLDPIPVERYRRLLEPRHGGHLIGMLVSEEQKRACLDSLAARIEEHYLGVLAPGEPVVVAPLLNGAMIFASDLMQRLRIPAELDSFKVESYAGTGSTGETRIHKDLSRSVKGRHVLLVEDIIDTGHTIDFIINGLLRHKNPASVSVATFLDKAGAREVEVPIDYTGFVIPKMFVVGYGLDYRHELRNLPFVAIYRE
jgi:hypoxanthine phosphoribosyltransferase